MSVYTPPLERLKIIHADDALIAVDKPAGLLSVPGRGVDKADCVVSRAQQDYPDALTVHRLDMATSGLLLLARGKKMQRALSGLFERGDVAKRYVADVWSVPNPSSGKIDLPLITDWPNRPLQKIDHESGKPSQTLYETMSASRSTARLALTPLTGRSHQLRVHLAAIGHPILGDEFYAHAEAFAAAPRLCLHAAALSFRHPLTGETLNLESPCPF